MVKRQETIDAEMREEHTMLAMPESPEYAVRAAAEVAVQDARRRTAQAIQAAFATVDITDIDKIGQLAHALAALR